MLTVPDDYTMTVPNDSNYTHRALGSAALNWVLKRGIHLASLRLPSRVYNTAVQKRIRDAVASLALLGHIDKLETISLFSCSYINNADLVAILSKCYGSVKSIDIASCGLSKSAAAHIKRCTKLEAFAVEGHESAADMAEIFQSCRKLRKVSLTFGGRLTDDVVESLVVADCHLLEHLDLSSSSDVSEETVKRVAESCPMLQYVDFAHNRKITDVSVLALCNNCSLLKRMFFEDCRNLTDVAVLALAEALPGLTHIDLSHIGAITNHAVKTLAKKCRALEYIYLHGCPNISDVALSKIAKYCSNLSELCVDQTSITDVGLAKIATKCSKLKTVWVNDRKVAASLKQKFPHVDWCY